MPSGIIIVGLGPGSSRHWTRAAHAMLNKADTIYLRTAQHPGVKDIPARIHALDQWSNEENHNPEDTHNQVATEIIRLAQHNNTVIYAVPGHPIVDNNPSVPRIRELAETAGLSVTIIPGLSILDATLAAINLNTQSNLQIVDAAQIADRHHPPLETGQPALIMNLLNKDLAIQVKNTLLNAYPDDCSITLIQAAGTEAEQTLTCPLWELDTQSEFNTVTALYLPAENVYGSFSAFQETIAHLRSPEGCPWDRKQTHQSLRPYLIEETYEVLETLDANDPESLAEELGDLLLQILLHTQIAIDTGEFKMNAVIDHINRKLLRRHPHVFGNVAVNGVDEVATNWEAIKKAEKTAKGQLDEASSALDGIPPALPALSQAMAVSKKAVRVGFEWPNIEGVLDKIIEEAQEIVEATDPMHLESEFGDLLFSVVNLARWQHVDPEIALRTTNARFIRRFKKMEALVTAQEKSLPDLSIEEMDMLWEKAKKATKG